MKKTSMILTLLWALILSSSALAGTAEGKQRLMTLEDIPKISSVTSIATSPNGKWVAYTKSVQRTPYKDDEARLGRAFYHRYQRQLATFYLRNVNISSPKWSTDSKHLYYLSKRNSDKFTSLYRIPVNGGESTEVYSHKSNIIGYNLNADNSQAVIITLKPEDKHQQSWLTRDFRPGCTRNN